MSPTAVAVDKGSDGRDARPSSHESIEERCFCAALICLEGHYTDSPPMGPLTTTKVTAMVSRTLEKTHGFKDVREALSRNVSIWIWLTRIFAAAIPNLTTRSVGPLASLNDPEKGVTPQESTALIIKNYQSLKEDLQILNKLMHIARNLLVTTEPEVPQDLCAAVHFDQMVYQTIILCVNVTSKGYDGEILDDQSRLKLNDITDLYKKILVTSLQQAHNWTAKNDRNKMSFWFDVLFDDDAALDDPQDGLGDGSGFRIDVAKTEVSHWLERNSTMCDTARRLLKDYADYHSDTPPGVLAPISPLAWNWLPEGTVKVRADDPKSTEKINPLWKPDETDKFEQDKRYGRVSREVDMWWIKARDANFDGWVVPMPSIEFAQARTENCKANLNHRYSHHFRDHDHHHHHHHCEHDHEHDHDHDHDHEHEHECEHDHDHDHEHEHECDHDHHHDHEHEHDHGYVEDGELHLPGGYSHDYVDDLADEDDVDDDESYGEGPMTGLLTEVPNILDPKQIEALHMIVKSCIFDAAGSGWTRAGENLQKTRCRMFLALDCGKSLLREMLVFIAVWEKDEQSLIFQITSQIVQAIHHSALIPYAWNSLRIPKDIISPAQTVLLRLVSSLFRDRSKNPPPEESKENLAAVKLLHFFFSSFRSRIVPECVALMHLQGQIRNEQLDPADFPVDTWDMERAKDGLAQFLDFLSAVSEDFELRSKLVEWEAVYDLLALLQGLETGVPKKALVELPNRSANRSTDSNSSTPIVERPYDGSADHPPPPPPPPVQDPAYKFPWAGVKGQILQILASLLQPLPGRTSPGNPEVQKQVLKHKGMVALLNCCTYDDHNRYARERVQLCLKWLMDGSEEANQFLRNLVATGPPPTLQPPAAPAGANASAATTKLRINGVEGDVKVQVRSASGSAQGGSGSASGTVAAVSPSSNNALSHVNPSQAQMAPRSRSEELLRDIINLADEAARLALGENGDETEDEEFMDCVSRLTERLKAEGIDVNLRDVLQVDTDHQLRNLRGRV